MCPVARFRHGPSPRAERLGAPNHPAIRFTRDTFSGLLGSPWLRPASLLAPLDGPDRHLPATGGFYAQAFNGSVTLAVAGYHYDSHWTPLSAGLAPAGMAASLAAPDPDVRDWRIRLLSSWIRCRTEDRVDGDRRREWIALLQQFKPRPRHRAWCPTPIQPLLPSATHFPAEPRDRHRVPSDPIVAVVAVEFAAERRVLPDERGVSMVSTPPSHRSERPAEPRP